MERLRKALILVFFCLHGLVILHGSLANPPMYPQPDQASGYTSLKSFEERFTTRNDQSWLGKMVNGYSYWLGISQRWNTFAPVPPDTYSTYYVVAVSASGEESLLWRDGLGLERSGAGLGYDPTVKMVSYFELPMTVFQQTFLASLAQRLYREQGVEPPTLVLKVDRVRIQSSEPGVSYSPPEVVEVMRISK